MSTSVTATRPDIKRETSMSLKKLVTRLNELEPKKRDIISPVQSMFLQEGKFRVITGNNQRLDLELTHLSVAQLCERLGIPKQYGHTLNEQFPALLAANVNGWLEKEMEKEKRKRNFLLRTYMDSATEGTMRAFLSERYFDISSLRLIGELVALVAEIQDETGINIKPIVCDMSDRNIFVRFIAPDLEVSSKILDRFRDPLTGNTNPAFFTGAVFQNSEVGRGMYSVAPRVITGACMNGAVYSNEAYTRKHLGGLQEIGDVKWSEETVELEIAGIVSKTKDLFRYWFSSDFLGKTVAQMEALAEVNLQHPVDTVVNIAKDLNLSRERTQSVMNWLAGCGMGGNLFGVMQAFTGAAREWDAETMQDVEEKIVTIVSTRNAGNHDKVTDFSRKFNQN